VPDCPLVVDAGSDAGVVVAGVDEDGSAVLDESPSTLTLSPLAETGRSTDRPTWLPDAVPSAPLVVAAFAARAPVNVRPPRTAVNNSPLDKILFMVVILLAD
jgi:hypothetical protein